MALFCLATSLDDLKEKLGNIVVGFNSNDEEIDQFFQDIY